jgi:tRNA (adenine37-N6)-methyltransferase
MKTISLLALFALTGLSLRFIGNDPPIQEEEATAAEESESDTPEYTVSPIGYVREIDGKTLLVLDEKYEDGLLRMEHQDEIWVLWWFDKNDTPEKRSILHVHPRGNPENPLTGVFATHSPVRPNLIAMTKCKIISVDGCTIEIEGIDAFPDTPILDIKSG